MHASTNNNSFRAELRTIPNNTTSCSSFVESWRGISSLTCIFAAFVLFCAASEKVFNASVQLPLFVIVANNASVLTPPNSSSAKSNALATVAESKRLLARQFSCRVRRRLFYTDTFCLVWTNGYLQNPDSVVSVRHLDGSGVLNGFSGHDSRLFCASRVLYNCVLQSEKSLLKVVDMICYTRLQRLSRKIHRQYKIQVLYGIFLKKLDSSFFWIFYFNSVAMRSERHRRTQYECVLLLLVE